MLPNALIAAGFSPEPNILLGDHPALRLDRDMRTRYSDVRDHLALAPELPQDVKAALLIQIKQNDATGRRLSNQLRGEPTLLKLTAMRCQWFGWVGGQSWRRVGSLCRFSSSHWDHLPVLRPAV